MEENENVNQENQNQQPQGENQNNPEETPSFDEVLKNKDYQSAFDKKITKAIDTALITARAKWEAEVETKQSEAEKLAKMTAEEKAQHKLQLREAAIAKKENEIAVRELRATAIEELSSRGLAVQLADTLNYTDAEACKSSIEALQKVIGVEVERQVNERLRGTPPKSGTVTKQEDYETRLKEARKNNNTLEAIKIKQEAAAAGKILL